MKSVAIIGAGLAGLTAGWLLSKRGYDVRIFEQSSDVGGVMLSFKKDGYLIEKGPNTILESSPTISQIIKDLGLESKKLYPDNCAKIRYIAKNNTLIPLPMSPPALIKSKLFSLKAKLRLACEPFIPRNKKNEETIADFVTRRLGKEFLDYAINPFVAGTYAGKPEQLSIKEAFPKLYDLEKEYRSLLLGQIKSLKAKKKQGTYTRPQILSFTEGLGTLPKALAENIGWEKIALNHRIGDISYTNDLWHIKGKNSTGDFSFDADSIIYAGTTYALKNITINQNNITEFSELQKIYYPPVSVLSLGFHKNAVWHNLNGFGFLVPELEQSKILGTLFSSSLFANRCPENHILLTTFIGGARQPELAEKSSQEVIENSLKDLRKYLGIKNEPTFSYLQQWPQSIPQYQLGYQKYKQIFDDLEKKYSGLFFIGNYRAGVSIVDTMLYAHKIATNFAN